MFGLTTAKSLIAIGIIGFVGGGSFYYLWRKEKKTNDDKKDDDSDEKKSALSSSSTSSELSLSLVRHDSVITLSDVKSSDEENDESLSFNPSPCESPCESPRNEDDDEKTASAEEEEKERRCDRCMDYNFIYPVNRYCNHEFCFACINILLEEEYNNKLDLLPTYCPICNFDRHDEDDDDDNDSGKIQFKSYLLHEMRSTFLKRYGKRLAEMNHRRLHKIILQDCVDDSTDAIDEETKKYIESKTVPCPSCYIATEHERDDGCHHITCSSCKYEWCYCCGRQIKNCGDEYENKYYPCPTSCVDNCPFCL
jgi:hypothetical protein